MSSIIQTYTMPSHVKGDTFKPITFQVIVNNNPKDLTNSVITIHFRKKPLDNAYYEMISPADILISDPTNGIFIVNPGIINYDAGKYYYDIEIDNQAGEVKTYIKGVLNVLQDITY